MKTYSARMQARLADEIDAAPKSAKWPDFIADYGTLRKRCDAIEEK